MSRALERLVTERTGLLVAGETIVAAGRARTVAGTESADQFPPSTIWAVSDRRLFVFDGDARWRRGLDAPLIAFDIADMISGARVEPFDDRDVLLVVGARGHPAMVVMDPGEATAIVQTVVRVLDGAPGTTDVVFGRDAESGPGPAGPGLSPTASDPTDGDERVGAFRAALVDGDRELAGRLLGSSSDVAVREWIVRHLGGAELAEAIDAWVAADPGSPLVYLCRGANTVWTAFAERKRVGEERFFADLRAAELDLFWAIELDFADPVPFTPLIRSALGLGIPIEELCVRFDESVRRGGSLWGAHLETLVALSPLGAGSREELLSFARSVARDAPEGSPLHALVPLAHLVDFATDGRELRRTGSFSSEAIRDVEIARVMAVDNEQWVDAPGVVETLNIFAAASVRSGEPGLAARYLERAGGVRTPVPWVLLPDGEMLYRALEDGEG